MAIVAVFDLEADAMDIVGAFLTPMSMITHIAICRKVVRRKVKFSNPSIVRTSSISEALV
jgi:hypothetical protein